MNVFGPLVPDRLVEQAIITQARRWLPTYLSAVCRAVGREPGALPNPAAWKRVGRFPTSPPDEDLPYVAVVSPGPPDQVFDDGTGTYAIRLAVAVGVLVSARDDETARTLASDYGFALAACVAQKATLDPLISQVVWRGARNDDGPAQDRQLATSIQAFWVTVEDVLDAQAGPLQPDPPDDPQHHYPDYGQVQSVEIDLNVTDIPEDT